MICRTCAGIRSDCADGSPILLILDLLFSVPPYEQISRDIMCVVWARDLAAGTRLPPFRRLAADVGLAPNTVARAYRHLHTRGVIETRGRHGSFVSAGVDRRRVPAYEAARVYGDAVRKPGIPAHEALAMAALDDATLR